jgi:hypothetical protein
MLECRQYRENNQLGYTRIIQHFGNLRVADASMKPRTDFFFIGVATPTLF